MQRIQCQIGVITCISLRVIIMPLMMLPVPGWEDSARLAMIINAASIFLIWWVDDHHESTTSTELCQQSGYPFIWTEKTKQGQEAIIMLRDYDLMITVLACQTVPEPLAWYFLSRLVGLPCSKWDLELGTCKHIFTLCEPQMQLAKIMQTKWKLFKININKHYTLYQLNSNLIMLPLKEPDKH